MARYSKNVCKTTERRTSRGSYENRRKIMKSKSTNTEKPVYVGQETDNVLMEQTSKTKAKSHEKRMYKCCVPLCSSYGPVENFIPFPSFDSQERLAWINKIPRRNWVICHNTVICRNHFIQNSIYTACEDPIVPKSAPSVFPDVPIFSNLENKYRKIDPCMLETSSSFTLPETFGDLEGFRNFEDFIFEFFTLKSNYREKVHEEIKACHWQTQDTHEYVLFYQIDVLNYAPSISISILINENMKVVISLEGIVMDPLDYTRHVPINGKITHWTQLRNMLSDFGWETRTRQEAREKLFVPVYVPQNVMNEETLKT